jgi:ATP-dependent helicase/nuclease subunit B
MDICEQVANGAVLLTVNQRLARHRSIQFQQWQQARASEWWETPAILPARSWLLGLHAQFLAAGDSTRTILPELLQQRIWQECIESDDSMLLLDTNAASRGARRAWDVACAWRCHPVEEDYLPLDQFVWSRWRARYQAVLDEKGCVDHAALADHILEILDSGRGVENLPAKIILDGFLRLPPQLEALVTTLKNSGVDVELLQSTPNAFVHPVEYEDDAQEMLSIALHMRTELERDINQSLGLVVPDLQNRRAEVLRSFDQVFYPALSPVQIREKGRPYDLSIGLPLADTSVIQAALSIVKLCVSEIRGSEISALLLSPYLSAGSGESHHREQLDKRLRDNRVRKLDLAGLNDFLDDKGRLGKKVRKLSQTRKLNRATLSTWATRFSQWLKELGWPGSGMDTEEYQAVSAWMECLDDLQLLDNNEGLSANETLGLLNRLARERVFQLDTPATPIQIMGRLESHGIAFDCLWVAGLDSEQWPAVGSPTPFLSIEQQKTAGVPDASAPARLLIAEHEFLQWSSQAPLLIASRAIGRDGKELDAARVPDVTACDFNSELAEPRLATLKEIQHQQSPVNELRQALQLDSIQDNHGPALPSGSEVKGGARLFENQALCPFKSFALHRLSIRPLEEAGMGLDPRQHGTLLHQILEFFWEEVKTQDNLLAFSEEEFTNVLLRTIDAAIDKCEVPAPLIELERTRLLQLLSEWFKTQEAIRPAFEVVSLEQKQSIEHGGIIMSVMLDRIDKVGDDLVVIDYKTGVSNSVNSWADNRISNPQLPLYVLTNEDIKGATFAQVARNQCKFKGVTSEMDMLPKVKTSVIKSRNGQATERELGSWHDWRLHWKESLDAVASEVRQGLATVSPMKSACTHCELTSLCRIGDEQLENNAEEQSEQELAANTSSVNASAGGL